MSEYATLVRRETDKSIESFIADFQKIGEVSGYIIHNEDSMEMANTFGKHGLDVLEGFDLHMLQLCNPEKASASLQKNPERAALVPKFVTIFSQNGKTQIRMLRLHSEMIQELVQDKEFAVATDKNYDVIVDLLDRALLV